MKIEPTKLSTPGKHAIVPLSNRKLDPSTMISGNPELGIIPKYWDRTIFANALYEAEVLKRGGVTLRSSHYLFCAETGTKRVSVFGLCPGEAASRKNAYTGNKSLAKFFFERDGLNSPKGRSFSVSQTNKAIEFAEGIGFPIVFKPVGGHGGHGIVLDIQDSAELKEIIDASDGKRFLLEKFFVGTDHRFFVLNGKAIAVWQRTPANVTGDGKSTIRELVKNKNIEKAFTFSQLKLNDESLKTLKKAGYTPDSIPDEGTLVFLNHKENLTQGGDAVQMIDDVDPSYLRIAEDIALSIPNSTHHAVDIMLEDSSVPATKDNWSVIETNSRPDILGGQYPDKGKPIPLSALIVEGYLKDRLDLGAPVEGEIVVTFRLFHAENFSKLDTVLEKIKACTDLKVLERSKESSEIETLLVQAEPEAISMLSIYMFHPEVQKGHHLIECTPMA